MVFLDRPKHEPKTAKERDEDVAKSKLLPEATGPYRVIWSYPDVIPLDIEGAELPDTVDRCSKELIVSENTKSFSGEAAYHPIETDGAQYPIHIYRNELDPTNTSSPLPFFGEPQSHTPSTRSDTSV